MKMEEAITGRRSIRKFKNEAVPREVIASILDTARWAPSWGNTQPWQFYVITGEPLEAFRKANRDEIAGGKVFAPDVSIPEIWPDHLKKRYGETGKILLGALGIAREDKEGRNNFYGEMALLFGAPALIIACIPRESSVEYAMLDIGLVVQTICLLAHGKGLGTCIMAAAIGFPKLLRSIASIPEELRITVGIALGYPDGDAPINTFSRVRAELPDLVQWID
ncbi:MAG: nitroreductase [Deltaproteobacteria bacterium]|nr:nitroreductase [Deltaproteobacteria bacterium]MBN2687372.1 nitroreductase [Deltaproteobacteria bacterium]